MAAQDHVTNTDTVSGRLLASAVHESGVSDLMSDVTSSLTGHDIIEDDFPKGIYGQKIQDVIVGLRMEKNMTRLAVNRNMEI